MTEEQKNTQVQHECFCQKRFKDVLVVALGTFIGVYCALSLFSALHRPQFPMFPQFAPFGAYQHRIYHHMGHFKKPPFDKYVHSGKFKGDFEKFDGVKDEAGFKPEKK